MYQPDHHREDRLDVQHGLIEAHPFGLLISTGPEGLVANGLPFILRRGAGPLGLLRAHIARANTQWQGLDGQRVLVVFQGAMSYVSPSFYETKKETGISFPPGTMPWCRRAAWQRSMPMRNGWARR